MKFPMPKIFVIKSYYNCESIIIYNNIARKFFSFSKMADRIFLNLKEIRFSSLKWFLYSVKNVF